MMVEELLTFKAKLDELLAKAFDVSSSFAHTLKESCEAFINVRQNKPAVSKNDEFCMKTRSCAFKTRNFVFKTMNYAGAHSEVRFYLKNDDFILISY